MVPVRVCFSEDATGFMWVLEVCMTFSFIADMYFTFNTVYFDSGTGQWITTRRQIALNYLKSWFWVDAPSSVPVELVDVFVQNNSLGLLRFLRMFRLLRLLRLLKIEEYVDRTRTIVVFCSRGYFRSINCLRELGTPAAGPLSNNPLARSPCLPVG